MTTQTKNRDSFIFYRSFFSATKCLNQAEKAQLFDAICSYALDNEIGELNGTAQGMFELIKPQLDANRKRFENGCVKKQKISKTEAKNKQKISKTEANVNVNVNENEECKLELINDNFNNNILIDNNIITKKEKVKNFVKPTIDELIDYCDQNALDVNPNQFIDNYESVGWKVGKNPMKDWQATARNWHRNNKNKNNQVNYQKTNGMTAKEKSNWQAFHDFGNNKHTF
jgi:hypothetical protein